MNYLLSILISFFLIFQLVGQTNAQKDKLEAFFSNSKAELGQPIIYSVIYAHAPELIIQFPNDNHDFEPFHLQNIDIKNTVTIDGISYDTILYTLLTFEKDSIQRFSLPILRKQKDRYKQVYWDTIYTPVDSFEIAFIVPETELKEPKLRANLDFKSPIYDFNYPFILFALALGVILLILIYVFFGEKIKKRIKIWHLNKQNRRFLLSYDRLIYNNLNDSDIKETLALSKFYLSKLLKMPFTTYTTKQMVSYFQDSNLTSLLNKIDRMIYAKHRAKEDLKTLEELRQFCVSHFEIKRRNILLNK